MWSNHREVRLQRLQVGYRDAMDQDGVMSVKSWWLKESVLKKRHVYNYLMNLQESLQDNDLHYYKPLCAFVCNIFYTHTHAYTPCMCLTSQLISMLSFSEPHPRTPLGMASGACFKNKTHSLSSNIGCNKLRLHQVQIYDLKPSGMCLLQSVISSVLENRSYFLVCISL